MTTESVAKTHKKKEAHQAELGFFNFRNSENHAHTLSDLPLRQEEKEMKAESTQCACAWKLKRDYNI